MTWFFVAVQVLFVVWLLSYGNQLADSCAGMAGDEKLACEAGTAIGGSIGIGVIFTFWVMVDIILGIAWLVTRPKTRECPRCGTDVRKGVMVCGHCNFDWRTAMTPVA